MSEKDVKNALLEIMSHLGAAQIQRASSDDQIIANHIDRANEIATNTYRSIKD